jgi:hypothetical protein
MNTTSTSGGNKKIPANMMKNFKMNPMTRTKTSDSFWKKFLGLSELMKSFNVIADFLESICHGLSDILHRHALPEHLEVHGRRACHRYYDPQQEVKRKRDSIEKHQKEKHDTYGSRVPYMSAANLGETPK